MTSLQYQARRLAKGYGWTPEAIKGLVEHHQIPTKASDRTEADWRRLIVLLMPPLLCLSCGCRVVIPGLDYSYCDRCSWVRTDIRIERQAA